MSSVYYNISQFNNTADDELFQVNQNSFDAILDQQNNYQVGVKRFKIPATTVDTFRIYEDDYIMGVNFLAPTKDSTVHTAEYQVEDLYKPEMNRLSEIDTLRNGKKYMEVQSQAHFAQILTRTLFRAIKEYTENFTTEITSISVANQANMGYTDYNPTFSGTYTLSEYNGTTNNITFTPVQPILTLPIASNTGQPRKFLGFEVAVKQIVPNSTSPDIEVSDLIFQLEVTGYKDYTTTTTTLIDLVIGTDFANNVKLSQFASKFPNGFVISSFSGMINQGQSDFDPSITPHFAPKDDCDFQLLGGAGEYYGYSLIIYQKSASGASPVQLTTLEVECNFYNTNEQWFVKPSSFLDTQPELQTIGEIAPYFTLNNEEEKRLQFNAYFGQLTAPFSILCNSKLMNILGFDGVSYDGNILNYEGDLSAKNAMLNPSVLTFDLGVNKTDIVSDKSTQLNILEPELSLFKRNFLYAILITANSLSIDGEYEGNGSSQRKILSDFEIDPSTNFRDYLIYQPSGNSVRYYDMNSSQDLRNIFVSVFYRDMFNVIRPFTIGAGNTATIKLHFRKKSADNLN